jgi:hypothetical protein
MIRSRERGISDGVLEFVMSSLFVHIDDQPAQATAMLSEAIRYGETRDASADGAYSSG